MEEYREVRRRTMEAVLANMEGEPMFFEKYEPVPKSVQEKVIAERKGK